MRMPGSRIVFPILVATLFCATLQGSSVVISTRESTTLFGSGLEYTLNTLGNGGVQQLSFSGSPVALTNSGAPMIIAGYATAWGSYTYLTGASLTFSQLAGMPAFNLDRVTGSVSTPFYIPGLSGSLGNITITIKAGNATRTTAVAAANLTSFSYDLFNNGFADQLLNGATLNITFDVQDTITAATSSYGNTVKNETEHLFYSDSRIIDGSSFDVVYDDVPEPLTTILIGTGLVLMAGLGVRRSKRS